MGSDLTPLPPFLRVVAASREALQVGEEFARSREDAKEKERLLPGHNRVAVGWVAGREPRVGLVPRPTLG